MGLKRREEKPDYTGQEEFNFFLAVAFPDSELEILPYNRVVRDLNGLSPDALISQIEQRFIVKHRDEPVEPEAEGHLRYGGGSGVVHLANQAGAGAG